MTDEVRVRPSARQKTAKCPTKCGFSKTHTHNMTVYTHPNIDAGSKIYDDRELKYAYPHLSVLREETMKLKDVKIIFRQNCYRIHRPEEYKSGTNGEPKRNLKWTLCGPLPQQEAVQVTASCVTASEDDALAEQIKTWWDIESYAYRCDVSGACEEDEKNEPQSLMVKDMKLVFSGKEMTSPCQTIILRHWTKWSQ